MIFIPIRTESPVRRTPAVNYAFIFANVLVFLLFDVSPSADGLALKARHFVLHGQWPAVYQFLTYQFAHADIWHLLGNMLFLWVFGNSVNAKFGNIPYLLFYIGGGAFAGLFFAWWTGGALLGASGSIAAVTTAYMMLFPRSRVLVLFVFFLIRFLQVPAMVMIGLKIILWDNIIAPHIEGGGDQVAYSAHLAGYFYGLAGAALMLAVKAVPRDQFDALALIRRWTQRRAFAAAMTDPRARAQAQLGSVARVEPAGAQLLPADQARLDELAGLRARIAERLQAADAAEAAALYERLVASAPEQCLPAGQQLEVARHFYTTGRFPQAAAAFERYLARYRSTPEAAEVVLLLGIICARDLQQFETAERHLGEALKLATGSTRREQAERWLQAARASLGRTKPEQTAD